jgi:methyltransferase (TIGR00027 family)
LGADGDAVVRRWLARAQPWQRYMRAQMVVRSRYVEDALRMGVAAGLRQYVLLGAGLDTFAYRNPYESAELHVYEVDHPATQAWKRQLFAAAGLTPPASLRFVPVDLERDVLDAALSRGDFRCEQPTLFAWLGVVPYLTPWAIEATLRVIVGLAPGSGVIFDYGEPPGALPPLWRGAYDAAAARVAALGEPWITFFEPADLARQLHALGFAEVHDLDGSEINGRYFAQRGDGLRASPRSHLVYAAVG